MSAQLEIVRKELQLSAQLGSKGESAAECADQNCCFVGSGIKAQFCGCSPYTRGTTLYLVLWFFCVVSIMILVSTLISR